MHEFGLMTNLLHQVETVALAHGGRRVTNVRVRLGALSNMSRAHFREHFLMASKGTLAEGAELDIQESSDPSDPHSQDILIESVDIEGSPA